MLVLKIGFKFLCFGYYSNPIQNFFGFREYLNLIRNPLHRVWISIFGFFWVWIGFGYGKKDWVWIMPDPTR